MSGRVFVTRRIPDAGLSALREAGAEVAVWAGDADGSPTREQILAGVAEADVLLSLLTEPIDARVMEHNPRLRGISNYAVGYDNIDLEAAERQGIPVGNTPEVLTETTADLTWALILAVARRVVEGDAYMRAGRYRRWGPSLLLGRDVSPGGDDRRKTLGVIGFGRIGQAVARRATGFDMHVLAWSPGARERIEASGLARWAELDTLLGESDFVTLHAPLDDRSHHLIGADELRRMKRGAYLINTARGPIVDEKALVEALRTGEIAGAGLDVYEREPEMAAELAERPEAVLLPHLGSATAGTRDEMARLAAANAIAMLDLLPVPHCVNPEIYDGDAWHERVRRIRNP